MEKRQDTKRMKHTVSLPPSEKRKMRYVKLNVLPDDILLTVRQGETILEALQNAGIEAGMEIEGDCGGLGKCGKCKVRVLSALDSPSPEEEGLLDEEELNQGIRLACRTKIEKDLVFYAGETEPGLEYHQVLETGYRPLFQLDPLLSQQLITLSLSSEEGGGLADLERIKLMLGPEYKDIRASLHCLRKLPQTLAKTHFRGSAVFHDNCLLDWQDWEKGQQRCGLVFDLGTSTLVGKLINLQDGSEVVVLSCVNSQMKHGSNVISRLQYINEHVHGLERLHNLLIKDLNRITERLLELGGLEADDIFIAVAVGNTTMQHFLLGVPPYGIAEAPFPPVVIDGLVVKAADVGLRLHPEAVLYTMPIRSGYIGGDLISDILVSEAAEQQEEIVLGLDLGTNGEIFLGNGKRLLTCSAAAGPALEGAKISRGMIARAGAIEGVSLQDGQLHYRIIGNIQPIGICGSGLVDLTAILLDIGIIDYEGLIHRIRKRDATPLVHRIISRGGVNDFLIASAEESYDNRPIYLTQKDIRQLQLAKAAIAAGINTLMDEMGIGVQDINRVYLAGALGNYVNPISAIRIGLLPKVRPEIIWSLGNAASTGASMVLLSKEHWRKAATLAQFIEHIELSYRVDFNQYFIEHMDFPEDSKK